MSRILNSKIFSAVLGAFIMWLALSLAQLRLQKNSVSIEVQDLNTKIEATQNDNSYLEKFLAYFQSPAYLEKEARIKLNYKTAGENVVFVYKDKNDNGVSGSSDFQEILKNSPDYKKWLYYLLGY